MNNIDTEKLLSDRELEILKCIHQGLSNSEIAGKLFITILTVKAHISSIFLKLGAKNRIDTLLMLVGEKEILNAQVRQQIYSLF